MKKKKTKTTKTTTPRRPIAAKVVKKLRRQTAAKVVDLRAVIDGKKNAEALQKTVATRSDLADLHPLHAIYVYAQNQTSVLVEQLSQLAEMDRFTRLINTAEDDYMPSGPPMSPLTTSFFTCWSFFDAWVGLGRETFATVTLAVGRALGMNEDLLRIIEAMQNSRMGVYAHEGYVDNTVVLRELVTNQVCHAISPSGYRGRAGQLWYVRLLPPATASTEEHVVFTTPYVLSESEPEWLAYFDRTLPKEPPSKRTAAYEQQMKWGPARDFWNEYVFRAYLGHQHDAIFLRGIPDIPKSSPHG